MELTCKCGIWVNVSFMLFSYCFHHSLTNAHVHVPLLFTFIVIHRFHVSWNRTAAQ